MDSNIPKKRELEILFLYLGNYNISYHIREIARLLDQNHRTILLTLRDLEKKGILESKIIGRSKVYSINTNNLTSREYIRCTETSRTIILLEKYFFLKKFVIEVLEEFSEIPIILFGSYAKGTQTKRSDIDITILFDNKTHPKRKRNLLEKIRRFSKDFNLVIQVQKGEKAAFRQGFKEKDPLILEIVANHVIINNSSFFIDTLWRLNNER